MHELFDPVAAIKDPRKQIMAFFDIRKTMIDESPHADAWESRRHKNMPANTRGIVALGRSAASNVEERFVGFASGQGFAQSARLGKQINVLFQGALLLAHVSGDSSSFVSAKAAVLTLLEQAASQMRSAKGQ